VAGRLASGGLWAAAFLLAVTLGFFQRTTGPTYPMRGEAQLAGTELRYELPRTHAGAGGLSVALAAPDGVEGSLDWRRYPTDEPWRQVDMHRNASGSLEAIVPHQPPAGKVEYRIVLRDRESSLELPGGVPVVARFRGEVPAAVLIPHILAMFAGMLLATRAALEVLRPSRRSARGLVLSAMASLMVGGLVLGPLVQKFAFDAFWTGWPFGTDLTDNKTLVAVLAWLPASVLAWKRRRTVAAVVVGWMVVMGVFLIPHSLRGSEIDWSTAPAEEGENEVALLEEDARYDGAILGWLCRAQCVTDASRGDATSSRGRPAGCSPSRRAASVERCGT
jgi:hypothetical protein